MVIKSLGVIASVLVLTGCVSDKVEPLKPMELIDNGAYRKVIVKEVEKITFSNLRLTPIVMDGYIYDEEREEKKTEKKEEEKEVLAGLKNFGEALLNPVENRKKEKEKVLAGYKIKAFEDSKKSGGEYIIHSKNMIPIGTVLTIYHQNYSNRVQAIILN